MINQIFQEVVIANQRAHAVVTGKVDQIQRLLTIGGLLAAVDGTPTITPSQVVAILVFQFGKALHVIDDRSRHGDVCLSKWESGQV